MDLISRQAAIDICTSAIDLWSGQLGEGALIAVRDRITGLPSAQQERGRWIKMNGERGYECSECGWESDTTWDFCPNCGALNIER